MAEGPLLSQRLSMQQVLAPQMQQSLALLQAPALELRALVEQELEQNPVLEEIPIEEVLQRRRREEEGELASQHDPAEPPSDVQLDPTKEDKEPVDDFQAEVERIMQLDEEWREFFSRANPPLRSQEEEEERRRFLFDSIVARTSLQQHLLDQVRLTDFSDREREIAEYIVGNVDDNGYLKSSISEIALATGSSPEEVKRVLKVVQSFDPPGVAARDLKECLLLQLERAGRTDSIEYQIIQDHMDLLARRRVPELARALGRPIHEIEAAIERISHLEPKPGREFAPDENSYVVPELTAKKVNGRWVVEARTELIPHLRISNYYKDLMTNPDSSEEVRKYIRDRIRAGKFLIKCIHQRQETLLKIAQEIVSRQEEFFERGPRYLKPLTMAQVAEAVGLHETTVSRAVNGKYIETPWGIYELRDFFMAGVQTDNGEEVSNASVKERIAEMVRQEDPRSPLSDEEIVQRLAQQGIHIARRTVAKYRSELGILPSHLRRIYST